MVELNFRAAICEKIQKTKFNIDKDGFITVECKKRLFCKYQMLGYIVNKCELDSGYIFLKNDDIPIDEITKLAKELDKILNPQFNNYKIVVG